MSTVKIDKLKTFSLDNGKSGVYSNSMFDAEKIKNLRIALGLNQEKFANLLGVTKSAVSLWEKGRRHPPYRKMERLNQLAEDAKVTATETVPA